ncbi:hypothetical protein [Picrophilus oshimae]|uniref:Uncharacterized protein n=1 Tax=Picrophilus torridus (strain ATCC 700027 / DSM 9790 / JCM 10055 / NBRC 100828 / KAW 2/3) TaxID=1122961 RepID=Q6L0X9_PICTO|nr:hypothetical protein [Picrophilus oshimae]AAT43373.1 hypothetical protein PTO0788 [Picrophilus oshimae DSM 9789]SMD30319.1 hypothetical protein SAMN02745355_0194 [Picrophilus oshimae DSM 9789]
MVRIGVYTTDFKFYHDVVKDLKRWRLPFVSLASLNVPDDVTVVLSSRKDDFDIPRQIKAENSMQAIRMSLSYLVAGERFYRVIIGIDPGPRPGIAVMADNILMEAFECPSIDKIRDLLSDIINGYIYENILIKIGNGDKPNRELIIKEIKGIAPIIIVNEKNTSTPHKIHDNALSAARISLIEDHYDCTRVPEKFSRKNVYEKEFITLKSVIK